MGSKILFMIAIFYGNLILAERPILPTNQWVCQVQCGELPRNNGPLTRGVQELRKVGIQAKATRYRTEGGHSTESCGSKGGYESCYLISRGANLPQGFHLDEGASKFKASSSRAH